MGQTKAGPEKAISATTQCTQNTKCVCIKPSFMSKRELITPSMRQKNAIFRRYQQITNTCIVFGETQNIEDMKNKSYPSTGALGN